MGEGYYLASVSFLIYNLGYYRLDRTNAIYNLSKIIPRFKDCTPMTRERQPIDYLILSYLFMFCLAEFSARQTGIRRMQKASDSHARNPSITSRRL